MNIADKKLKLQEYGIIKRKLRRLEDEKAEILARGTNTVAPISDMPRGTDVSDRVGNTSVELQMIDVEIKDIAQKLKGVREEVEQGIDSLDSELQKDVMYLRYIMLYPFDTIACSVNRDKRTVERIHGRALQRMVI